MPTTGDARTWPLVETTALSAEPSGLASPPTAVQISAAVHETPRSGGLRSWGVPIAHDEPFQVSKSEYGTVNGLPPNVKLPTAAQNEGPKHETPVSSFDGDPTAPELGLGTIDQLEPFHISTRVSEWVGDCQTPTAIQVVGPVHETLRR